MKHVEIKNEKVVSVRTEAYPLSNPSTIEAPDEVECGWLYDGKSWTEPPEIIKEKTISIKRQELAAKWSELPVFIRGPFQPLFAATNALLDAGDADAAAEMIRYAAPMAAYSSDQIDTFEAIKSQFITDVQSLIP